MKKKKKKKPAASRKKESLRRRRRLLNLWEKDPHCCYCGCPTVLLFRSYKHANGKDYIHPRDDEATIEHLRSRWHPQRQDPVLPGEERTSLSCWKCNNEKGAEDERNQGILVLQARSQHIDN
tara:strand:- start:289 stop:654 length:366 start_codon:yes stop_codon:yes gene_type:complete